MSPKNRFKTATYSLFPSPSKPSRTQTTTPLLPSNEQSASTETSELVPQTALLRARISSVNLFSIISKFEALDALSLPPREMGMEPQPLQIVNQNSKRNRAAVTNLKRLSTIFSLRRESPGKVEKLDSDREEDMTIDGEITGSEREGSIGSMGDIGDGEVENMSIGRSWRYQLKGKTTSPRKRRGSSVERQGSERVEDISRSRGKSIKDMIRFYDGATPSRTHTMVKAMLTRTPTTQIPVSSIFHEKKTKKQKPVVENSGPDKLQYFHSIKSGSCHTPAFKKLNEPAPTTPKAEQICHERTPISKTAVRSKSPFKMGQTSPIKCKLPDSHHSSTRRSLRASLFDTPGVAEKKAASKSPTTPFRGRHSRSPARSQRLSSARVKVGSRIEALYRVKSMEREIDNFQMQSDYADVTPTKLQKQKIAKANVNASKGPMVPSHTVEDISPSKVADIKKLFEKPAREEQPISGTPKQTFKLENGTTTSSSTGQEASVEAEQLPSTPTRHIQSFSNRTSGISPKTVREIFSHSRNNSLPANVSPTKTTKASSTQPKKVTANEDKPEAKQLQTKSKSLGDRIRLFEDIGLRKSRASDARRKKRSFSAKFGNPIINSRKSIFELASRKTSNTKHHQDYKSKSRSRDKSEGNPLSIEEVRDIVADVEKSNTSFRARWGGKRKSQVGKWAEVPKDNESTRSRISNASYHTGCDRRSTLEGKHDLGAGVGVDGKALNVVSRDIQILLARASGSLEMVVKEAECGLKEPKPMRLVEMKRMMVLCREKPGALVDRERREKQGGEQFVKP